MPLHHTVALLGLREFERSALASYFRLAANRTPSYEQVELLADAQFVVADAEHPEAVAALRAAGRLADAVFVGSPAPAGATRCVARPIDPLKLLRELDAQVARTIIRTPRRAPSPSSPSSPPALRPSKRALLVDDSEIALRYLETRLQPLGLQTERAGSSGAALERLSRSSYDFVFIDIDLGDGSELDGLALCRHIQRQPHHSGGAPVPLLAIVSAFQGTLDRARGTQAGADAYFGKPLDQARLEAWLRQHGVMPPASDDSFR